MKAHTLASFVALVAILILPDLPRTTPWLTEEERQLAVWRLEEDIGEDDWTGSDAQTFGRGLKLALADIKTWILTLLMLACGSAATFTNFFPTVAQSLPGPDHGHVSSTIALLLTTPPYMLAVVALLLTAWHADRTGGRYFHLTVPLYFAIVAFVLAAATESFVPRYIAMLLMVPSSYAGWGVSLSWISSTLPRPPAKRAAALALINAVSNSSNIWSSYLYSDGPRFVTAFVVNGVAAAVAILAATVQETGSW